MMASSSPSATVLCTAFRLAPDMVVLLFLAAALLATPARSSSASSNATGLEQPTVTFCSGHSYGGVAHMSAHVAAENRTMYGAAQCRPEVSVADCAACLAAASELIVAETRRRRCAASAVWHDACFLRYSDHDDTGRFRSEDEYTATVFDTSRVPLLPHEGSKAVVRRLLVAAGKRTMSSCMFRGVGAGAAAGGLVYGLTRCAAGISCADCRRCLGGALKVLDREYNGSAGMQVLRLSCMVRYESYPFYNTKSLVRRLLGGVEGAVPGGNASTPAATPPVPVPPGGRNPPPPPASGTTITNATVGHTPVPPGSPRPATAAPNDQTATGSSENKAKGMSDTLIVSLVTWLVVTNITLAITMCYPRKRRLPQRGHVIAPIFFNGQEGLMPEDDDDDDEEEEEEEEEEGMSCKLYSYQVLEAATCRFSTANKLGSGGFGTVYKGTLENGKEVAVKRLRDTKKTIQELEREVFIETNLLQHKNLVRFLGYCFQKEGKFLIYEFAPNNSLDKFLYKAFQREKLEWATWFNIILGVARGLRFLHNRGVIHRDLKPHNVLLDGNFNPKITDFDLMRMYDKQNTHVSTKIVRGTFGYMAPECTSGQKFLLSTKSDVYSYGVLVLEIITGHKIYTFEGQDSEGLVEYVWQHWTEKRVSDVVDGVLGVEEGQEHAARQALRCVHVALLGVQSDRARRPTMGQVISMLSSGEDGTAEELPEPSLPGYVVRPTKAASGAQLSFGCR